MIYLSTAVGAQRHSVGGNVESGESHRQGEENQDGGNFWSRSGITMYLGVSMAAGVLLYWGISRWRPAEDAKRPTEVAKVVPPGWPALGSGITERYKSFKFLASGASALVFSAKKCGGRVGMKLVAVKCVKHDAGVHAATEARILSELTHPHIVRLHESRCDDMYSYLVLDYVPGGEMFDYLINTHFRGESVYDECACRKAMRILLSVLEELASKNIVHRDIKPENICLLDSRDLESIRVIDFGVSCIVGGENSDIEAWSEHYAPPEAKPSPGIITPAFDIWSAGVVFHLLLFGRYPADGKGEAASKCSPAANDLLSRMLEPRRQERISARNALQHSFFRASIPRVPLDETIRSLRARRKWRSGSAALRFVSRLSSPKFVGKQPQEKAEIARLEV